MMNTPEFRALNREASLAQELVCAGTLALKKANASQTGIYSHAFFCLANGLERMGKLCVVMAYLLENQGKFPADKDLRSIGHDVRSLVTRAEQIRATFKKRNALGACPKDQITQSIIEHLSEFAKGARYYNLDFITQSNAIQKFQGDPIAIWRITVGQTILEQHYKPSRRAKDEAMANDLGSTLDTISFTRHTSEDGTPINSQVDVIRYAAEMKVIQKWSPFYVLRLVRFFALLIIDLHRECYTRGIHVVPYMGDHFGKFNNGDDFLKRHKVC